MHASMCYTNNTPSIITNSCTHVRNNLPKDFRSVLRNRKPVHTSAAGTLHTCHNIFSLSLFPSPSSSSSGRTHNLCLCQWYYFFIPTKFDYQKRVVFISFFWKKERKKPEVIYIRSIVLRSCISCYFIRIKYSSLERMVATIFCVLIE